MPVVPATTGPGWRSPAPRRWAAAGGLAPVDLARQLADELDGHPDVARCSVLGDGMLHVVLTPSASGVVVAAVLGDPSYGSPSPGRGGSVTGDPPALPRPGERVRRHPVFAVLWAHARASTAAYGATPPPGGGHRAAVPVGALLDSPAEDALLTALAAFPDDVARARDRAALLWRMVDLADRTHGWLDGDPLLVSGRGALGAAQDGETAPVLEARTALAAAAAQVLASGLGLLGLPAPARV